MASSVTSTGNRRCARLEPGNSVSIASISRTRIPGGPATSNGLDGVWLPLAMLRRLTSHGPWDAPFTEATAEQERVLLIHALADRHNESGLHRGTGLTDFLDAIPYEPTVPIEKVPAGGEDHDKRGRKSAG